MSRRKIPGKAALFSLTRVRDINSVTEILQLSFVLKP